ncbi:MAG: hypothetical protein ACRC2S_25085 [Waterburya sp.]
MKFRNIVFFTITFSIFLSISSKAISGKLEIKSNQHHEAKSPATIPDLVYSQAITHQVIGSRIVTKFAPKNSQGQNIDLNQLASSLGYDHFNWVNYVEKDPYGITNHTGQQLSTPYNDPPKGGYNYDRADELPFYWDLVNCDRCKQRHHFQNQNNLRQFELVFEDSPVDYRLQPGEAVEFVTHLVGVKNYDVQQQTANWEILYSFRWQLTNLRPNYSQVTLVETDVSLTQLSPVLLSAMQLDGIVLPSSVQYLNLK